MEFSELQELDGMIGYSKSYRQNFFGESKRLQGIKRN